jgi:hypothetical protein
MERMSAEMVAFFREQYPTGSRIKLSEMKDDPWPIEPGSMGTLEHIDDAGQFHVRWDNGRSLAVLVGKDRFTVLPPELTILKFYMPLTADLYQYDDYGDLEDDEVPLNGQDLCSQEDAIIGAMVREQLSKEAERGIMNWYQEDDSVNQKVKSVVFTVETRNDRLWGVAQCRVIGELTPEELHTLKEYITGQASDGWGEGFEQREIQRNDGVMYVHLWSSDHWDIQTEQERFSPKLAEGLPQRCFSILVSTGELICIMRGESGYYPSDWSTADKEKNMRLADEYNEALGVTPAQRRAMEVGAMVGWDVPGADPKSYEIQQPQQRGEMIFG